MKRLELAWVRGGDPDGTLRRTLTAPGQVLMLGRGARSTAIAVSELVAVRLLDDERPAGGEAAEGVRGVGTAAAESAGVPFRRASLTGADRGDA